MSFENKYAALFETDSVEIVGVKYSRACTVFVQHGGKQVFISGFPACPECSHTLNKDWKQDRWVCPGCDTVWTAEELIQAIEAEQAIVLKGGNDEGLGESCSQA